MAERRMFAKSVIGSARFLRMPPTSRLLYYDLGMQADDDGVVEAFSVMRTTGATEDDLKVLASKGFVTVMNDDLVTYITDWSKNNYIQNDRYRPSIYKELLVKMNDVSVADTGCIHDVSILDTQDRLGKDRLGKDSIDNMSVKTDEVIPYSEIIDYLNKKTDRSFRNVDANKKLIKARWNDGYKLDDFKTVIDNMVANWSGKEFNGTPAETYLQPKTLFSNKFDSYLNQIPKSYVNNGYQDNELDLPF